MKVGDRVILRITDGWGEEGEITGFRDGLVEVTLDETIELPGYLGGGWLRVTDREPCEIIEANQ